MVGQVTYRVRPGSALGALAAAAMFACTGEIKPAPNGPLDCSVPRGAAVSGRRITGPEYRSAVRAVFEGKVAPSDTYPESRGVGATGFSTEPLLTDVGASTVDDLMLAAEDLGVAVANALPQLLPCANATAAESCAQTFLDKYGRRAYRRQLTGEERTALLSTYRAVRTAGGDFIDAMAALTTHLAQTPQFIYRLEGAAPRSRALTDDELASRLAMVLWGSIPDDALLDAAAQGELKTAAGLSAQLDRMLAAPAADPTLARFLREWLQTERLNASDKDRALYPQLDAALASSINESFDRLAASQVRDGTLAGLLTSTRLPADAKLAALLGAAPVTSWTQVEAPGRPGVAGHPAVLAAQAHAQKGSFILRGRLVMSALLCQSMGAPPANAMTVFAGLPLPADPTGREVSESINQNSACASCHRRLNPPGLAFERYDAIGQLQPTDRSGRTLDVAGQLLVHGQSYDFDGPSTLMNVVAGQDDARVCFARQLFRFTFSRLEGEGDSCTLTALEQAVAQNDGSLRAALTTLLTSGSFTQRVDP